MVGAISITNNARILLLCALVTLSACQKESDPADTPAPQAKARPTLPVKKGPTAAELTAGMVEAAGEGKAQGPIDLKFELPQKPKVGQALEVNVALLPQIDATMATIQITGAEDFSTPAGNAAFEIPSIAAGEVYRHTLNVTPTAEGVLFMGVTLQLKNDENIETRVFSIPIIVDR